MPKNPKQQLLINIKLTIMKLLTLTLILLGSFSIQAQETAVPVQNIILKLDETTRKISLFNKQNNTEITKEYELISLELEIFDVNGQYAGSLELKSFVVPQNEVSKSEKVKVAKMQFKHIATGEQLTLTNKDFVK